MDPFRGIHAAVAVFAGRKEFCADRQMKILYKLFGYAGGIIVESKEDIVYEKRD